MSDVSSATNFFPTVNEGFITTVGGGGVTSGGTTVPLTSISGLTNGSIFVGIVEPGLAAQQVFTGTVDTAGTQITDVVWTRGANAPHTAGKTVVDYVTGTTINLITKGILTFANQDGTLKAVVAPSATISGAVTSATLTVSGATSLGSLSTSGNVTLGGKSSAAVQSLTSGATLTPNADSYNIAECTALATNTTIAAPTGTPANMQSLTLRIRDNGTARTLSWNATYVAMGVTLPTTTVANKTAFVSMVYSSANTRWEVLSVGRET